ncbi:ribose ABC transporter substrate-binding protein [Spirochaetia bacterium]|nr:ribose ABC transporter substrate-binding protein [Spirochaetia bacterium]
MKRTGKILLVALVVSMMIPAMIFAGGKSEGTGKKEYSFVFIPKLVHPWYEAVKAGIEQAIADYKAQGITVNYTWDATITADVLEQMKKLENAAAKKVDAIGISIIDASVTTAIINDLISSNIRVATFDTDAPESNRLFYCGHADNRGDGATLARELASKIGEKGEVAILAGTLSAPNHKERVEGFKTEIAKYPNIKIVAEYPDDDSLEKAISLTESIIQSFPNLAGIFGCNASNPVGAAQAVTDAGKKGVITIVGMDDDPETIKYLAEGTIYATVVQNVKEIGYRSVQNMILLTDGKPLPQKEIEVGAFVVKQDSLDNYYKITGNK